MGARTLSDTFLQTTTLLCICGVINLYSPAAAAADDVEPATHCQLQRRLRRRRNQTLKHLSHAADDDEVVVVVIYLFLNIIIKFYTKLEHCEDK